MSNLKLPKIQQEIWDTVLDKQDLRDDSGHAQIVTEFAIQLATELHANLDIVIPAAILHDTGYHVFDSTTLNNMMQKNLPESEIAHIKEVHMDVGAKLAKDVLTKLRYNSGQIQVISHIILYHDTMQQPTSVEEKVVRDADKLWRYSNKGFFLDIKRQKKKAIDHYLKLQQNLKKQNYFWTEQAIRIAQKELEQRKQEF